MADSYTKQFHHVCTCVHHENIDLIEGVYLTLPLHIFSVQVKSRSMLHHGSVGDGGIEFKIK